MASAAQVIANIENAKHSTGPRSEQGKAASSHNALKHGLTALTVLLPGEDEAAYRKLCAETSAYWKPANAQEEALVQHLSDTQWRIARCARLEAAVLSADTPDFKAFDSISKHEARLKKVYSATLKETQDLIAGRIADETARMRDAITIRRADNIKNCETNLTGIGFDFSLEQVDAAIAREDALEHAQDTICERNHEEYEAIFACE